MFKIIDIQMLNLSIHRIEQAMLFIEKFNDLDQDYLMIIFIVKFISVNNIKLVIKKFNFIQ